MTVQIIYNDISVNFMAILSQKEVSHEQFKKYYQNIVQNFTFRNRKGGKKGKKKEERDDVPHIEFEPHTMCGPIIARKRKRHIINFLPPISSTL